jgi:GNAT superfamily N-acetyltransferase
MKTAVMVRPITATDTHPLRRSVLRDNSPTASTVFDGDEEPTSFHLGAFHGDALVGVASFHERPFPDADDHVGRAVQLRGMAVSPTLQCGGVGAAMVDAALARLRSDNVAVVWANARDTALGFYRDRFGMVVGDGFVDATTGLAHHRVWLFL